MQNSTTQEVFDPGEYDLDFSFDLEFNLIDYLLMAGYIVLIVPLEALAWLIGLVSRSVTDAARSIREQLKAKPSSGILSIFSKIF